MTSSAAVHALTPLVASAGQVPDAEDVVAGWTAFGLFGLLILAVAVLGFSLTKRLKNVDRAAAAGLYDPSDPKRERPVRGLAAARQLREQQDRDES
jgi:hypothetical protein